ncbi:hypothetical protein HZA97_06060 [Candidatus Woesearchaeota archaeon]|nr:hypothetical protein [Candidatus Woesearchaeota archaeon]
MKELIKEGLKFNNKEKISFLLVVLVLSFIYSFKEWGSGDFASIFTGLTNWVVSFFIVGISVLVHHLTQKVTAAIRGFKVEHKLWWNGLVVGLLAVVLTNGRFMFFSAAGMFITTTKYRLGYKRQAIDLYDYGKIALWGPASNIFLGATLLTWSWILGFHSGIIDKIFTFNVLYAFYNLLPFPPLDGSRMFVASRINYIFVMSSYSAYLALIFILHVYSFIWATIAAYVILILYYYFVESGY